MVEIACVVGAGAELGEGALWDPRERVLYWVNIFAREIHRFEPATGIDTICIAPNTVGSLAVRAGGGLVAAMGRGFHFIDFATGNSCPVATVEPDLPENRMNDGKPDRRGRFWAGSMHNPENRPDGALYRLDPDLTWRRMVDGFTVSNALAFSPDGKTMYYGDSPAKTVWAWDLDPDSGDISNRRVFLDAAATGGSPDGAAVDEAGCYWLTVPRAWRVNRYDPHGRLDRSIELPVSNPTCVAFGGERLDTLYVTSATFMALPEDLQNQPLAGALLAIDVGVRGLPDAFFAG
ncbi:MAG: SMP-30/gluconolactonase/LRE family protein [Methylobacteriaceae bacterium]|nr:SMP-30/gluconolactonase/LRE family protein [Methylobacteriaceae bacterium]